MRPKTLRILLWTIIIAFSITIIALCIYNFAEKKSECTPPLEVIKSDPVPLISTINIGDYVRCERPMQYNWTLGLVVDYYFHRDGYKILEILEPVYYNDEMKNPEWHYQMIAESECASHRNLYNERIWEMGVGDEDNPERFIGMILYCKGVNPEDNKLGVMLSYDRKKNEVKIEENYMYEYIFKLSECRFP